MVTIREFENHAAQLRSQGTIVCSLHLCNGQEAIAVGARAALGAVDTVNATYRGHHWAIACGTPLDALFGEFMGRQTGVNGGRGGAGFFADPEHGFLGESGIVGGGVPIGVGAALAARYDGSGRVALDRVRRRRAQPGRGARGDELRRDLPPAGGLRLREQRLRRVHADRVDVSRRARSSGGRRSYGFPGAAVDGTDPRLVQAAVADAVARAREGGGPTLRGRLGAPARRTPHARSRALPPGRREGGMGRRVGPDPQAADRDPGGGPRRRRRRSTGLRRTLAPRCEAPPLAGRRGARLRPGDAGAACLRLRRRPRPPTAAALDAALHRAMQTYPETIVFGEDVAGPGGVFGVTRGLADEYGDRVFDTPISESAMLGAALGAAIVGRRPDRRDHVGGLPLRRHRPAREPGRQRALADTGPDDGAAHGADAAGRTHLLVGPALAMRRGAALPHPRAPGRPALEPRPMPTRCCSRRSRTTTRPS